MCYVKRVSVTELLIQIGSFLSFSCFVSIQINQPFVYNINVIPSFPSLYST